MNDDVRSDSASYNSEEFGVSLGELASAFARYGEQLEGIASVGDDFFDNKDGAIYSKGVGAALCEAWNDHIADDFGEFTKAFESWMATTTAEGNVLEDFKREEMNLYKSLNDNNPTGAYESDNTTVSRMMQENAVELDQTQLTNIFGDSVEDIQAFSNLTDMQVEKVKRYIRYQWDPSFFSDDELAYYNTLMRHNEDDAERRSNDVSGLTDIFNEGVGIMGDVGERATELATENMTPGGDS